MLLNKEFVPVNVNSEIKFQIMQIFKPIVKQNMKSWTTFQKQDPGWKAKPTEMQSRIESKYIHSLNVHYLTYEFRKYSHTFNILIHLIDKTNFIVNKIIFGNEVCNNILVCV